MTEATIQAPPETPAVPQVPIELGPDTKLYPEHLVPAEPPTEPQAPAPESDEPGASSPTPADAGLSQESPTGDVEKGSRRQKGEDAYQRGLREGRETADRERTEREQTEARQKATADEQARIRQLYRDLKSTDFDTRERAATALGDLVDLNEQTAVLKMAGRNETLAELAASFQTIKELEGVDEEGYKQLWQAANPGELAKLAFALGNKHATTAADERIAALEAQLQAERGKRAGASLTPDQRTGSNGTGGRLTLEQYQRMSAREIKAAGITSADIDAMTADMIREAAR